MSEEYALAWSDEFDGPAGAPADSRFWRAETGGHGWGNDELQYYTPGTANAALDGEGNLAISVRRADVAGGHDGRDYTSARLITKGLVRVRYGIVQARIKMPRATGLWPGFWLLGQDFDQAGWPACGEIDVMEQFGKGPAVVQGAVHGPGYTGAGGISGWYDVGPSLWEDFQVYSVGWEPGRIRWYVNDVPYRTVTAADLGGRPWVFDHEFFLLLNVAVGGVASVPPDPQQTFPQTMAVDYVRIWRPAPPGSARMA